MNAREQHLTNAHLAGLSMGALQEIHAETHRAYTADTVAAAGRELERRRRYVTSPADPDTGEGPWYDRDRN